MSVYLLFLHECTSWTPGLKIRPCFWGRISPTLALNMVVYFNHGIMDEISKENVIYHY
jgi:hypothetical protein